MKRWSFLGFVLHRLKPDAEDVTTVLERIRHGLHVNSEGFILGGDVVVVEEVDELLRPDPLPGRQDASVELASRHGEARRVNIDGER